MQHRNSQKRDYSENNVYFIVTKTFQNYPYFKEHIFCDLLVEELKLCKELKKFKLYGFCIIYDHLNLMIHPGGEFNISKIMQFIKRHFTRDINYIMSTANAGDIRECRLQGGDYEKHNECLKKYEKSIEKFKIEFNQKVNQRTTQIPKFKWQKSFHDHIIKNSIDFENHYNYTIFNFQKHNLPENWKYTSLNYSEMIDVIEL